MNYNSTCETNNRIKEKLTWKLKLEHTHQHSLTSVIKSFILSCNIN